LKESSGFLEAGGEFLTLLLVANVGLPVERIRGRTRHDDFHDTLIIIGGMPGGAQGGDGIIKINADAAGHADDHGFTIHGRQTLLPVGNEVLGNQVNALIGTDDRFKSGPLGLEFLFLFDLFTLGGFFKIGVDLRFFIFIEFEFGEAPLVKDGDVAPS